MTLTPWTIPWLKGTYLAGVRTTTADGTPYADEFYQNFMDGAAQWAQTALDISIPKTTYTEERHDFEQCEGGNWWLLLVDHAPVRTVTEVKLKIGNIDVVTVPASWIFPPHGFSTMVQCIPNPEEVTSWAITLFGFQIMNYLATKGKFPGWYSVTYQGGYDASELPADVLDLMAKYAACSILDIANAQVLGAGIKSVSQSQDGVSQSKSVGGYAETAKTWRDQIERDRFRIRRRFHGTGLRVA